MLDSITNGILTVGIAGLIIMGFAFALQLAYDALGIIGKGIKWVVGRMRNVKF